jgi:NAD(P)-dependent dehydrogenase (short-subunit alcohol dehydrogenase family)
MRLMDERVAVVTGAGQGIGRHHALRFAAEGARVVVNDIGVEIASGSDSSGIAAPTMGRNPAIADHVVSEIEEGGGEAVADHHDLSTFAGGRALIETALNAFGRVDVLVNNAGTMTVMPIGELDEERVAKEIAVHLIGYMGTTEAVWEVMKGQGRGVIINTAAGFGGILPGLTTYQSAKAAVFAFTRDTAHEGARHGIRCNSITPYARTRMSEAYFGVEETKEMDPGVTAATLAVFLASDLSRDITGRQLMINPGNVLHEVQISTQSLVNDVEWTPESLAARISELLHEEARVGKLKIPDLLR